MALEQSRHLSGYAYRYRPYLVGTPPDFEHFEHREPALAYALRRFSYLFKALFSLAPSRGPEGQAYDEAIAGAPSWYYDFTPEQALHLEEILRRLAEATGDKPLIVALLPVAKDLERFRLSGPSPLSRRLARVARQEGFRLLDLLPLMAKPGPESWKAYYHDCDYHWNAEGHRVAADLLTERMWRRADAR